MKKELLFVFSIIFFASFVSSSVLLTNNLEQTYNLGDSITLNLEIFPEENIEDTFVVYLDCLDKETEIYKEYLQLNSPQTKKINLPLIKDFIKDSLGNCVIKYELGKKEETISQSFLISDEIIIKPNINEITPGEIYKLNGTAILKNLENANGLIEIKIDDGKIYSSGIISESNFEISLPIPDNFKSGEHKIEIFAYEKDSSSKTTNKGTYLGNVYVLQVPTNLEIILPEKKISAGSTLKGTINLYDQTGNKINSKVYLAIKNEFDEIVEKIELISGGTFSYKIKNNQKMSNWTLSTYSEELMEKETFEILKNEEISVTISNKTVLITNVGNVFFSKEIPITIGNQTISINVSLNLGKEAKYKLSGPTGEHYVEIEGIKNQMSFTGNAIGIEKIEQTSSGNINILLWTFLILILGLGTYFFFKNRDNKPFFIRRSNRKSKKPLELKKIPEISMNSLNSPKYKAELSLSITGTKQNAPIGCLYLKNYDELKYNEGIVKETIEKISLIISEKKGLIYQNQGSIFYFLAPIKTKTFDNELPLLEITNNIKSIIDEHNRKYKVKIDYGLGLNFGTIITNQADPIKFMSMGTLMTVSKKLSIKSRGEIFLSEKFKDNIARAIKYERADLDDIVGYKFIDFINTNKKDYSKFINGFLDRQKKESN